MHTQKRESKDPKFKNSWNLIKMSKYRKSEKTDMLTREKLLPPINKGAITFLSVIELQNSLKDIDFFAGKHVSPPKKPL